MFAYELFDALAADSGSPAGTLFVALPCPVPVVTSTAMFAFFLRSPFVLDRVMIGDRSRSRRSSSTYCLPLLSCEQIYDPSLLADDASARSCHSARVVPPGLQFDGVGSNAGGAGDRAGPWC